MKKQILNIVKVLSKDEQKDIQGSGGSFPYPPVSECNKYVNQQSCEANPQCVWGDWTFEGNGTESCAKP
ncbi:hypothetical protein ATO12_08505 [Aquimarina atlantica]|uniref:Uncharacterized protein n=1 Tax=Aquimarina atlantica TaxID=1317122 RepID=A0A023BXI6_9FLAO|nr:hypothetical protein [Aquimarina atlantica]EZH74771.1 hypothetical protein ATO12_08505 [Aquimarina atlantica]